VFESLVEATPELAYAVVAGALTVAGTAIEILGVQTLTGGEQPLGRERVLHAFRGQG